MSPKMKYHYSKSCAARAILGVVTILAISGCSHYQVGFSLTNGGFKPKGQSIAIISGTKETQNVALANLVADSLRKKSRYQVTTPAQIAQLVQPYPMSIKGPYKSAYFHIDTDWDLGDRKRIVEVQRALDVDYLYVIWAPIALSSSGRTLVQVHAVAQLFERPNAKEVAKTSMVLFMGDEGNLYFKEGADEVARQLAEETNMAKTTKK